LLFEITTIWRMSKRYMETSNLFQKTRLIAGTAAMAFALSLSPASAEVILTANDGSIKISGDLLSYDGESYLIKSKIGEFQILSSLVICEGADCPEIEELNQEFNVVGSEFFLSAILPSVVQGYAASNEAQFNATTDQNKDVTFRLNNNQNESLATISASNSQPSSSFASLLSGDADLAITSRRITNQEVEQFIDAGLGDLTTFEHEKIIGQDGLVVIVPPENDLQELTLSQIEGVFSGRINNWNQLGGTDLPINVYAPSLKSGEAEFFQTTVLDVELAVFDSNITHLDSLSEVADRVANDPAGIGLTSNAVIHASKALAVNSECGIVSSPDTFSIKSEDYPLSRRLYLYTNNRNLPSSATDIVEFVQNQQGQEMVAAAGLTSLAFRTGSHNTQGNRLAYSLSDPSQTVELANLSDFVGETFTADQLSVTFRFSSSSSQLDNKALSDVARLAEVLESSEYSDRQILLVGFTDSIGKSELNKVLSERRAEQVLNQLLLDSGGRLDISAFNVLGYGAAAPVACNSSDLGRQQNRRVEVWVR